MKETTMNKTKILAIVGSTASGKSALAMALAERLGGEIVSCDSMQIYLRMDIGTAKPTAAERATVRHHMIDVVEPTETFTCADYVAAASRAIEDCASRGRLPIVCGGTGLYLDALLRGGDFAEGGADEDLRRELAALAEKEGNEALHAELRRIDPESADAIHPNNVKRVIRAIEIYRTTGTPKSVLDRQSLAGGERYDATVIGLRYFDRARLYERIDRRVDLMLEEGLLDETRRLRDEGVFLANQTAAQAIGYKELLGYLDEKESLETAVETLKMATRRYAKRQMTWFSAKPYVQWLDADEKTFDEIVNIAEKLFSEREICDKI